MQSPILPASELNQQVSPYLRAHAKDAVKWQHFTTQTFAKAKELSKPILLSSGYSTCYWCHRMAEDSFRNRSVGRAINEDFVPILIDRELEPEVDAYLQAFMTQQRGFGGWPVTVILTPDAKPIAGFSYQNADATLSTLKSFKQHWLTQREAIETSALKKAKRLEASRSIQTSTHTLKLKRLLNNFLEQTERIADNDFGGFGQTEKFPFAPQLATLLNLDRVQDNTALRTFLQTTLQAMLGSGLRDHVGGGFFRYSDSREWSAPHYEQMLYTQALMAPLLLQAGKQWNDATYTAAGREVLLAMISHFQRDDGLFRAALSAVSEDGIAGGYYLWDETSLRKTLGEQYSAVYPLPTGRQSEYLPLIRVSGKNRLTIRQRLLEVRKTRRLSTDDKALLGWNGLALSALAQGLETNADIRSAGERLAKQLTPLLRQADIPRLIDVPATSPAPLADQIYLIKGLRDWAQATQDTSLLKQVSVRLDAVFQRYYQQDHWQAVTNKPLIGQLQSAALVDNELPSPTGIWLQLTNQTLSGSDSSIPAQLTSQLKDAMKLVTQQLPDTLEDDAFFHGTTLTALLFINIEQRKQESPQ